MIACLLVLFFQAFGQDPLQYLNLTLPFSTNFNGHISEYITSKDENNVNSTHNCLIVPCTVVNRQQKCIVVTKKTYGGDCYTRYFNNPTNLSNPEDVLTVEFSLLIAHHPQSKTKNSGFTIGWTDDVEQFYWAAAENANALTDGKQGVFESAQFVEINGYPQNTWTKVRFHIKPNNTNDLRLVFEAYEATTDFAGQFILTNLTVFHRGQCSRDCLTCQSFFECTSCEVNRLYRGACLNEMCYYDAVQMTADKISIGWISENNQIYGVALKNVRIAECHSVKFTFNKFKTNYINGSNPQLQVYQYGYKIDEESISEAGCKYYDNLPISMESGYVCEFDFVLSVNNTAIELININWRQEFYYLQNNFVAQQISSDNIEYMGLSEIGNAGQATTRIEGSVLMCKDSSCRSYATQEQTLYVNQMFYILVKLSEGFRDFGADYKFALNSAFAIGNGTNVPLKSEYDADKNQSARIFGFRVPAVIQNCTISISTTLVDRDLEITSGNRRLLALRRILQTTTDTADTAETQSNFQVSGNIKVKSIQILPGWWIYRADNVPYIILGSVSGIVLLGIFIYFIYFLFLKKIKHQLNDQQSLTIIEDENQQRAIKQFFEEQGQEQGQ